MSNAYLLPLLSALAGLASLGLVSLMLFRAIRLAREAERRTAAAEELAARRGRCLSLAAADLRGLCLALSAEGRDGVARQLMRVADDLSAAGAGPGARSLKEMPEPLGPVVDAAVATVSAQIRPGRRHWQVDPALRALTLRADARALQGAITALLRRAAQHSRDGDVVALRHHVASDTLAIVIEDEGDGLTASDLAAEGEGVEGGTRGLDLGLSLARSLAVAHGGDIRLESAPGIGARAWLTLPRERLLEAA
jgi:signal transduction histidine kinase